MYAPYRLCPHAAISPSLPHVHIPLHPPPPLPMPLPPADQQTLEDEIAHLEQRLQTAKAQLHQRSGIPSIPTLAHDAGTPYPALSTPTYLPLQTANPQPPHSPPRTPPALRLRPPSRLLRLQLRTRILPRAPQSPTLIHDSSQSTLQLLHVPAPLARHARQHRAAVRSSGVSTTGAGGKAG